MRDQGRHLRVTCAAADHGRKSPAEQPIAMLLVAWQATGARPALEQLLQATRPRLERRIMAVLRQHGVNDPNAADDAMSLVLDHVRRLSGPAGCDRPVAAFEPGRADRRDRIDHDAGLGYLLRLARSRAIDLARARRTKDGLVFSDLPRELPASVPCRTSRPHPADQILAAAAQLEPRQRAVVERLIDGQSQAMIAAALKLSEGTVSRLRARAVARLRESLAPIR